MEIRRVQMTGGSSYIITLPKEWIKSVNIKKNDQLGITRQSDGTLLISPKMIDSQTEKFKIFKVNERTDHDFFLRQLVGAYIAGYSSIKIISQKGMPSKVRDIVRKFTQITIGQEVMEETDNSIILKDLLNPIEMPFNTTIKRMYIIVKSMYEDSINGLMKGNKNIQEEILLRDNDVDRLYWLVARQHNIILQNVNLSEKMGITIRMGLAYFLISKKIERMGDHVVKIAQNVAQIADSTLDENIMIKIQSASNLALDIFNKSIGAFFRKDISVAISISYIVESIRRIGEYAEDISETTINYLIGEN
jgi:phosphate uptake regulator